MNVSARHDLSQWNDRSVLHPGSDSVAPDQEERGTAPQPIGWKPTGPARPAIRRFEPPERAIASACERRPAEIDVMLE
jgi:hypothetical protein